MLGLRGKYTCVWRTFEFQDIDSDPADAGAVPDTFNDLISSGIMLQGRGATRRRDRLKFEDRIRNDDLIVAIDHLTGKLA
jgi:hypothetical protein